MSGQRGERGSNPEGGGTSGNGTPGRPAWAGLSDVGRVRAINEDAFVVEPPLFAVADGLGGHSAGEVASGLAIDVLVERAPRHADAQALARAVQAANRAVLQAAAEGRGRSGMGTTLTAVMAEGTRVAVAHAGDSRAYLLHEGSLSRLTEDHSLVADMVRQGTISEEESRVHPVRSVVTRALGSDPGMVADAFEFDACAGDRLLLATDGLHGMLEDAEIAELLGLHRDPGAAARALVDAANEAGGQDNITVVVADIADEGRAGGHRSPSAALRRTTARLLWVVAAMGIVGTGVWGTYAYAHSQAFLVEENGYVAVYEGLQGDFAGATLRWRAEMTTVPVDALSAVTARRLREGIRVDDLRAARALVDRYRLQVLGSTLPSLPPDQ